MLTYSHVLRKNAILQMSVGVLVCFCIIQLYIMKFALFAKLMKILVEKQRFLCFFFVIVETVGNLNP